MTFITPQDYADYEGENIRTEDFPRIAARACEAVDAACGGRIGVRGFDSFLDPEKKYLRLAACIQMEWYALNGVEAATDGTTGADGYHIGNTSITLHAGAGSAAKELPGGLCGKAYGILAFMGLVYRGACVV